MGTSEIKITLFFLDFLSLCRNYVLNFSSLQMGEYHKIFPVTVFFNVYDFLFAIFPYKFNSEEYSGDKKILKLVLTKN